QAFDMHGLKFLARPNIDQPNRLVLSEPCRQLVWSDQNLCILLVAGSDVLQNLLRIQARVALANLLQCFVRSKSAMAAAADVVAAKKRSLRARVNSEQLAHG